MRKKLSAKELRTIRLAATYVKKAADIIYERGDGNLYSNGVSEKAYNANHILQSYLCRAT